MRRHHTVPTALAAVTAVLALGGCGEQTVTGDGSPRPQPTPTPTQEQSTFEKRAAALAEEWPEVQPVEGRPNVMLPLEDAEQAGDDARTLTVTVGHGACIEDYGTHLEETDDLVIVSGWAENEDVDFCTDELVLDKAEIELDAELGDRVVVDAATGEQLIGK